MNGRISAHIAYAAALGSVLFTMASCLRETPGHCAFVEGDATCEEAFSGTFCIFQGPEFLEFAGEEYRNVSEAQRMGCYESRPMTPEREDMGVDRKFFGCVSDRLDEGEDLTGDLGALLKGQKGEETYDLPAFLDDHGITEEKHELGCRPEPGSTTTETSNSSSTITGSEGSTTDGVSSESSTTGPMGCMGNGDCTDAAAPFCDPETDTCVACNGMEDPDAACAELDSMAPLCVGEACVQCTPENPAVCDAQLLVCDGSTGSCVACTEHAQCGSGACELDPKVGRCFPGDFVVHVDGDGGADYTTIVDAVDDVPNDGHGVIVVHERDGGADYGPTLISAGSKIIALLAAPGEAPIIQGTGSPGLRASAAGTILYVDGLTLSGNTSGLGLRVDFDAHAWVDRSHIVQNAGGGIRADGGAVLTLRNSFVGGDVNDADALFVDGATASVLYSTLGGGSFNATALTCTAPIAVEVLNSILVTRGGTPPDEVACAEANIADSVTEGAVAGEGNVAAGMFPSGSPSDWFLGYTTGNLHLQNDGLTLFDDVAEWQSGDPTTDIDGNPRPMKDGTPDYAGADLP